MVKPNYGRNQPLLKFKKMTYSVCKNCAPKHGLICGRAPTKGVCHFCNNWEVTCYEALRLI